MTATAADVALAVGPRSKRRLVAGAVGLVSIGALILAIALVTRLTDHPGGSARSSTGTRIVFGMTPQQVRSITGPPASIQGSCWLFAPHAGKVGPIRLAPAGTSFAPGSLGDLKLCFSSGVFSAASIHLHAQKAGWRWIGWPMNVGGGESSQ